MSTLLLLLCCWLCMGLTKSAKCPDVKVCQCFWDLTPRTTVCRINILHMMRGGIVQASTERLILHTRLESVQVIYRVETWRNLESLYTVDRVCMCSYGICHMEVTSELPASKVKTSPKLNRRTSTTTLPACFTTPELYYVFSSTVKFTCSTEIYLGPNITISFPSWNIYMSPFYVYS